jgi:hypothetical protein
MHDIQRKIETLSKYQSLQNRLNYLQDDVILPLTHLIGKIEELNIEENLRKLELLKSIRVRFAKLYDIIESIVDKQNKLKERYINILGEENICPTCFSNIDSDVLEKITHNL